MHEWKDYVSQADWEEWGEDPEFKAYAAGFEKAKEIYSNPSKVIAKVTDPMNHYLWWRESQEELDANS